MRLARHITHVHQFSKAPVAEGSQFDINYLRCFVAYAKRFNPFVPRELTQFIADQYVQLREEDMRLKDDRVAYTTARTLLGILRLSQALAKLRFSDRVTMSDIHEAIRLMEASKSSLLDDGTVRKYVLLLC